MIDYSDIPVRMDKFIEIDDWEGAHDLRKLISKLYDTCFDKSGYVIDFKNEKHLEAACKLYHDTIEYSQGIDTRTSICWDVDCAICGQTKLGLVHRKTSDWEILHESETHAGPKHHIWCKNTGDPRFCWNCYDKYKKYPCGTEENSAEVMKLRELRLAM